jgi:hypothetical protein
MNRGKWQVFLIASDGPEYDFKDRPMPANELWESLIHVGLGESNSTIFAPIVHQKLDQKGCATI